MDIGFETIGNATLIAHDRKPVLVTDPWIQGSAYFGSWKLSHEVPEAQFRAACDAEFVWFSHGHPDHLNGESLPLFRNRKILLPDHVGGRVAKDLKAQGFQVMTLPDRVWVPLSPRIRVLCIPDYNQDAVLLIDINGRLVMNLNDASDHGWGRFVRRVAEGYEVSFLLALYGFGDADMINLFDESGRRIGLREKTPLGATISQDADYYGARYYIPFSCLHRYQRTDSAWASPLAVQPQDFREGWSSNRCELLPSFIRFDCARDRFERIDPKPTKDELMPPEAFGDDWKELLEKEDVAKAQAYFERVEKLQDVLDVIRLKVGGREHTLRLGPNRRRTGLSLTFEAPRKSLMTSIEYEIFDDLLIGNFMKVTLHGDWGPRHLYPDFTPWVAKYGDNGRAHSKEELAVYFAEYRKRDQVGYVRHLIEQSCVTPMKAASQNVLRGAVGMDSPVYKAAKKTYWLLRGGL